nr:putative ribonuclease H-like domain-containing protein [Tanacetum cinerariifolium]
MFDCDEMFHSESDVSMPASPVYDRPSTPIIEDWVSDSEDKYEVERTHNAASFVHPPEHVKIPRPSVKPVEHPIPVDHLRQEIPKFRGNRHSRNRKACFVCKSLTHLIKDCDYYEKQTVQNPVRNHAMRVNAQHYAMMTNPKPHRHVVPISILTKSKLVPLTVARPVMAVVPQHYVTRPRPVKNVVTKSHSPPRRTITHRPSPPPSNFPHKVTTAKALHVNSIKCDKGNWGNPQQALKDNEVIDSGCSRHMTRNMFYLSDVKAINGEYVTFGGNPKGGKITGKGKIRTGKLDFDDVYFVKELKFNLFSISLICDKKNNVLFIDTECIVLSFDFKLPDESHVLLRVPKENNMYNFDLKNIVSLGDLTCIFAKEILDESNLWHKRLGHINFKTMNKLVKGNLVRGLPSKVFENNQTCVACKKGKQHRASCKSKPVSSISQPLQRLHMDLFGPTFVKNLNKKCYCLVVTDDYSRFSWVFFLATKDETSPILQTFITGIDNQLSLKVKILRSDSKTEFKNHDLNQFCGMKEIKREFSVPRTPQQNGISERKNITLIEVLTKPHNKTPYELLLGRIPSIGFMRPFGCHVTILNTLDLLCKFDGKAGEGFLVGYSNTDDDTTFEVKENEFEVKQPESEIHVSPSSSAKTKKHDDKTKREAKGKITTVEPNLTNNTNTFSAAGPSNTVVSLNFEIGGKSSFVDPSHYPYDLDMPALEDITYLDDEENACVEADFSNLETNITEYDKDSYRSRNKKDERGIVVRNKAQLVAQGHTQEEDIDYEEVFTPVARIEAIRLFLAYASFIGFIVYRMDVKSAFLMELLKKRYMFVNLQDLKTLIILTRFTKWSRHSMDYIKLLELDLCKDFEKLMKDKFQMSSMGKLTLFFGLQVKKKPDGIFISPDKYVAKILRKFVLTDGKSASTQ